MVKNLDDDEADLLAFVLPEIRERFQSIAPEVIVPMEIPVADPTVTVTVPKIGDKKKLLELSEKNVHFFLLQKKKEEASQTGKQTSAERILRTLQSDLQMADVPLHIECFDNSNMQGSYPVSSCVVFRNAKPSKGDYRHYNVKTVVGPNDFATMEEVVYRRYKRLLAEGQPLPQLIIIDGGKGQLGAAVKSLEALGIGTNAPGMGNASQARLPVCRQGRATRNSKPATHRHRRRYCEAPRRNLLPRRLRAALHQQEIGEPEAHPAGP
jgi:excinuclease ABC subunit C